MSEVEDSVTLRKLAVWVVALSLSIPNGVPAEDGSDASEDPPPEESQLQIGGDAAPLRNLRDDAVYLLTFPRRPTRKGVLTASAIAAGVGALILLDDEIRETVQEARNDTLDLWESRIEPLGGAHVILVGSSAVYAVGNLADKPHLAETGRTLLEAFILNEAFVGLGKGAFARQDPGNGTRPSDFFEEFPGIFPSGHTARAFAVAAVLSHRYGPSAARIAYPLAALVGLSRIERDVHWASDVLAGAALGYGIGKAVARRRAERRREAEAHREVKVLPMVGPHSGEAGIVMRITF